MSRRPLPFTVASAVTLLSACSDHEPLAPRILTSDPMASVVSYTGRMVYQSGGGRGLVMRDFDAGSTENTVTLDFVFWPAISPDLQRVAFNFAGNVDVMGVDGLNRTTLATGCGNARWSPDGARILASCSLNVTLIRVATGEATVVPNTSGTVYADWSADGTRIFITTSDAGRTAIAVINTDGTGRTVLFRHPSNYALRHPRVSPDGSLVLWLGVGSATPGGANIWETWAMRTDGSDAHLVWNGFDPAWAPDGAHILFRSTVEPQIVGLIHPDGTGPIEPFSIAGNQWDWRAAAPPIDNDADDDGVIDSADNCPNDANADQLDTDTDGAGNACDSDDDGDGVSDAAELAAGSDPLNASSVPETCDGADNDLDGQVDEGFTNTDGDAQADCVDADDDNDGVSDVDEIAAGSDPLTPNSRPEVCDGADNDGDSQVDEGFPNNDGDPQADCVDADDDNDGVTDAAEITAGSDPMNANSKPELCDGVDNDLNEGIDEGFTNTDGDSQANCIDADDDNDGVSDAAEATAGSDPLNATSTPEICDGGDNDLNEGTDEGFTNTDGDSQADCVDPDDDNDGFTDVAELAAGSDPLNPNSRPEVCDGIDNNGNGQVDEESTDTDGDTRADCVDLDDDNDGLSDAVDDTDLVVSSHFTRGTTAGTLGTLPVGVTAYVDIGTAPNGVSINYSRTGGNGAALVTVDFDGAGYNWQSDTQNCSAQTCVTQFTRSGNQVQLRPSVGSSALAGTLYGAPSLITGSTGASATVTETIAAGALTDATVTTGSAGTVHVNGLTIANSTTTAIGRLVAKSALSGGKTKSLTVTGTLTQSASSNGMDPLSEAVVFQVGAQTFSVAASSFTLANGGTYNYSATISGVQISIQLKKAKANEWTIKLTATPSTQATPTNVGLRVGNDVGVTTG